MTENQFQCRRCGNCCRWAGYVRLTEAETSAIADYLGLDSYVFAERYTRLTDDRRQLSLTEQEDGSCIFVEPGEPAGCRIEPVKPQQCRDFPHRWNFPGWENECAGGRAGRERQRQRSLRHE